MNIHERRQTDRQTNLRKHLVSLFLVFPDMTPCWWASSFRRLEELVVYMDLGNMKMKTTWSLETSGMTQLLIGLHLN
jgi:hypothetical protein